jgi:hypothetical protein
VLINIGIWENGTSVIITKKEEGFILTVRKVSHFSNPIDFYEGFWINNQRAFFGRVIKSNGEVYQGQWKNDLPSGFGKLIDSNGLMYQGNWLLGVPHGKGIEM